MYERERGGGSTMDIIDLRSSIGQAGLPGEPDDDDWSVSIINGRFQSGDPESAWGKYFATYLAHLGFFLQKFPEFFLSFGLF